MMSEFGHNDEPRYVISVAAQLLQVHPQTLRLYEREGLIEPGRSRGRIRLYSDHDIERLRMMQRLTNDLGVNLAGAEVILNMREVILDLQRQLAEVRRELDIDI
ncbi:MAG TPA: helix-turn-helix transcriptional regulator [Chloroflexia bacterium]|jgi:MerR family transcriptional regulator/heat shock protein HspR|nr:helix-turn-helix transcriptional regulator [Chloroflexia bacterium]